MATQTSSSTATAAVTKPQESEETTYTCKWGKVTILNRQNYSAFASTCQYTLIVADAWDIVKEVDKAPEDKSTPDYKDWKLRRNRAIQIIYNSVSQGIRPTLKELMDGQDVKKLWDHLETKYSNKTNKILISIIRTTFHSEKYNPPDDTINAFVNRLRSAQEKLAGTDNKLTDNDLHSQLVAGLPDTGKWQSARQLALTQFTEFEAAATYLEGVELSKPSGPNEATANAANHHQERGRGRGRYRGRSWGRGRGRGRGRGNSRGRSRGQGHRHADSTPLGPNQCAWCLKEGHWKDDCWYYKKALQARDAARKGKKKDSNTDADAEDAQFASADDPSYPTTATVYLSHISSLSKPKWIFDSGASKHICGNPSQFRSIKRFREPHRIRIADGSFIDAYGYGVVALETPQGPLELDEVWYAPEFNHLKLISITTLMSKGIEVKFLPDMTVSALLNGHLLFTGSMHNGLVCLDVTTTFTTTSQRAFTSNTTEGDKQESMHDLMHRRLGHISRKLVTELPKAVKGVKLPKSPSLPPGSTACESCLAGQMKEHFNKKTDTRSKVKIQRIHADISGIKPESFRGNKYFMLYTDDDSRMCWVYPMKTNTSQESIRVFKQFKAMVENETGNKIQFFRADNGKGEFGSAFQDELKSAGIQLEASPPYKHSMNGVVERAMQTINKLTRSMIYEAKLPVEMWDYTTEHSGFLKNRIPTKALPLTLDEEGHKRSMTPYEAYTGKQPDLVNLRVFGVAAFPIYPMDKHPPSYAPRFQEDFILIGMKGNSIYRVFNYKTLKENWSADVKIDEYTYPAIKEPIFGKLKGRITNLRTKEPVPSPREPESAQKDQVNEPQTERTSSTVVRPPGQTAAAPGTDPPISERAGVNPELLGRRCEQPSVSDIDDDFDGEIINVKMDDAHLTPQRDNRTERTSKKPATEPLRRSERTPKKKLFSDSIVYLVNAMKAVHLEGNNSLGAPVAPFELVSEEEAMREDAPAWLEAIKAELNSIKEAKTYSVVRELPEGRTAIGCKWVLRRKFHVDGFIARLKARLVIKGYEQKYGFDYFSTFASVVRYTTLRYLLAKAATEDLEIDQLDVDTAFLNPELKEEIYMEVPEHFFIIEPDMKASYKRKKFYLRLHKSLYGLKQAPHEWFEEVDKFLKSIGFTASDADPNLYVRREGNTFLLLYVDDMLLIGTRANVDAAKKQIMSRWKCKDLGPAKMFVGFQIERNRAAKSLKIHQSFYIKKLLQRFGMANANARTLPMRPGIILHKGEPMDSERTTLYQQITGSLLYLVNCTRLEMCWQIGQLAQFMTSPSEEHLRVAKEMLRYLNGTLTTGVLYSGPPKFDAYSDASYGTANDRTSYLGWVMIDYGGAISWSSQKQKCTAQSTMEAEFIAASEASREVAWLEKLWKEIKPSYEVPTLWCDNAAALAITGTTKHHNRAKHIDVRYSFIRNDMVKRGRLKVQHLPGTEQIADALTKQLPVEKFQQFRHEMGLRS